MSHRDEAVPDPTLDRTSTLVQREMSETLTIRLLGPTDAWVLDCVAVGFFDQAIDRRWTGGHEERMVYVTLALTPNGATPS